MQPVVHQELTVMTLGPVSHPTRRNCCLLSAAPCIRTGCHPFSTMSPQTSCRHCLQLLVSRLDGLIPSTSLGRPGLDLFKLFQARLMASLVYLSLPPKTLENLTGRIKGKLTEWRDRVCLPHHTARCSRGTVPSLAPSQRTNISPRVRAGYPHNQQTSKQPTSDRDVNTTLYAEAFKT
ncbi:hypothetical protein LZ31DRAFT_271899 [Colletotrichum somersetense]|nr:hypothetical protein LZ31DRAFT_271899 [Colletotrichum somersetense]